MILGKILSKKGKVTGIVDFDKSMYFRGKVKVVIPTLTFCETVSTWFEGHRRL